MQSVTCSWLLSCTFNCCFLASTHSSNAIWVLRRRARPCSVWVTSPRSVLSVLFEVLPFCGIVRVRLSQASTPPNEFLGPCRCTMCVDQVMFVSVARGGVRVNKERWRGKAGQGRLFVWAKRYRPCRTHAGQYPSSLAVSHHFAQVTERSRAGSRQRAVPAMRSRRACMQPAH